MADWSALSDVHIRKTKNQYKNILSIPPWIPDYLFRNMDLPPPPFQQRGLLNKLAYEGETLKNIALGVTIAVVARPLMNYAFDKTSLPSEHSNNRFWQPDAKGTLWHLLSARTLTQVLSAESMASGLYRAFVLTNISPWLQSYLHGRHLSGNLSTLLAQLPAHVLPWKQITTNLLLLSSPLKITQQKIQFEEQELNKLAEVYLQSPLFDGNFEPVIDIVPLDRQPDTISLSRQPDKTAWQALIHTALVMGVSHIRLYPVMEAGTSRLYMRAWKGKTYTQKILVAKYSAPYPILWWTDQVMYNAPLTEYSLNPLSRSVIASLPAYLESAFSEQDDPLPYFALTPGQSRSHQEFAAMMDDQHGLILFDWNSQVEHSRLPKITVLTEDIPQPVTEQQLAAIHHTQPKELHPYKRAISRAAHDLFWLAAALYLDRWTAFLGDKIYPAPS
ncbi:hypothetical protein [Sansalvadorimonas verongulae]|uniref:hypothetical protein n=1 Tax=Sansalvadorimonas verongulae TaxID=2172824 RepID=UPI0012BC5A41|nr:hypothetical protein [Sansalvadorimonas verongulae]MTI12546.1 hypothetical protein [Sansalvadorimonas verongulae]